MGRQSLYPVKKLISLSEEQVKAIADYRFDGRFPSENEAIRDLIEKGLSVAIANQKTDNQSK
jgi:Arc/MetJ-type ribon-helix-helix transcriptional regulator